MEEKDRDMNIRKDSDQKDPRIEEKMDMKQDTKTGERAESSMDGPHLKDIGESGNRSQDEGKVYDL